MSLDFWKQWKQETPTPNPELFRIIELKKKKEREGKVISRSIGGIIHREQALPKPGPLPGRKSTSNGKNQSFGGAFSCQ